MACRPFIEITILDRHRKEKENEMVQAQKGMDEQGTPKEETATSCVAESATAMKIARLNAHRTNVTLEEAPEVMAPRSQPHLETSV